MKHFFKYILLCATGILLHACGGGGGGDDYSGPLTPGVYLGSSTNSQFEADLITVIEIDGTDVTYWASYNDGDGWLGPIYGIATLNGNRASDTDAFDYSLLFDGTVSITARSESRFSGSASFTDGGSTNSTSVSGRLWNDSDYQYTTTAPDVADVAGDWTFESTNFGQQFDVTVTNTGAASGSDGACTISGQFTPRTNANYYGVTVTTSGTCGFATGTSTGVAILLTDKARMIIMVTDEEHGTGATILGTKGAPPV